MIPRPIDSTSVVWRTFARLQFARLRFRVRLFAYACIPLLFWTVVGVAAMTAARRGFLPLLGAAVALWCLAMLPHVVFELSVILDTVGYAVTRRVRVYAWLRGLPPTPPALARETIVARRIARVTSVVGLTSPFNALAFWCFGVLIRVPLEAHSASMRAEPSPARRRAGIRRQRAQFAGGLRRELFQQFSRTAPDELAFV